ncbi:MAG TPA: methyltransferase domain-containing protein [Streptosporangiaceae bacterium]|nr:methyltransferase domain-containing protein [Streptosporangiaceae bacterium]
MAEAAGGSLDPWAEWLIRGRDAGLPAEQVQARARRFQALAGRVLDGARIADGDRVLDVGAGTGLIALAAAGRTGPGGQVVAVDISCDALAECRAGAETTGHPAVGCVGGEATRLPFPDRSFDVIVARSVLIYIADKPAAVAEMSRVLRPGGRVSVFEPINSAAKRLKLHSMTGRSGTSVPESLRDRHERVAAVMRARSPHHEPMTDFDERDLIRLFVEAGFDAVGAKYELLAARERWTAERARRHLDLRGNPTGLTWREAAAGALGLDADEYLRAYLESRDGQTMTSITAVVYLTAAR